MDQEVHSLQMRLEQKASLERWYTEEMSSLKQQLSDRHEHDRQSLETEKQQEIAKYIRQVGDSIKQGLN